MGNAWVLDRIPDRLRWTDLNESISLGRATSPRPAGGPDWYAAVSCLWRLPAGEFAAQLFAVLLGRPPSAADAAAAAAHFAGGGSKAAFARAVATSAEAAARGVPGEWVPRLDALAPAAVWDRLAALWPRPAAEFVRGAYQLVLGREADAAGLEGHLSALADGGSRAAFVRLLVDSDEFRDTGGEAPWADRLDRVVTDGPNAEPEPEAAQPAGGPDWYAAVSCLWRLPAGEFAAQLFAVLLGRPPSAADAAAAAAHFAGGGSKAAFARAVATSAEAAARGVPGEWVPRLDALAPAAVWDRLAALWPRPAAEFVRGAYQLVLGREADAAGLEGHLSALADGGSRAAFVRLLVDSDEFRDTGGEAPWAGRLALLDPDGLRTALHVLRDRPDAEFVRGVYAAVLFRDPGDELRGQLDALAGGAARSAVVRDCMARPETGGRCAGAEWAGVAAAVDPPAPPPPPPASYADAPDDEEFIRGAFRSLFGREPSAKELRAQLRRLRYVPFQTRAKTVNRLGRTWEAQEAARGRMIRDVLAGVHPAAGVAELSDRLNQLLSESERVAASRAAAAALDQHRVAAEAAARADAAAITMNGVAAAVADVRGMLAPAAELLHKAREEGEREHRMTRGHAVAVGGVVARLVTTVGEVRRGLEASVGELRRGLEASVAEAQTGTAGVAAAVADVRQRIEAGGSLKAAEHLAGAVRGEVGGLRDRVAELDRAIAEVAAAVRAVGADGRLLLERQEVAVNEHRAHHATGEIKQHQLRNLAAMTVEHLMPRAAAASVVVAPKADSCRVCGGRLTFRFRKGVMRDRYEAEYHSCDVCEALQIPDPHWLAEAYAGEDEPRLWTVDPGRFSRNFSVFCYVRALMESGLVGGPRVLDFGGGYGLLTQMLADSGIDAWAYDPYIRTPFFAQNRLLVGPDAIPEGTFDVAAAFEVFEHLTDPDAVGREFRRALNPHGAVVLSTTLYEPGVHGPDWEYLSCQAGQHVLFWTRRAMRMFADRHGYASVGYFPDGPFRCAVLSRLPAAELTAVIGRANDRLADARFTADATRHWHVSPIPAGDRPAADVDAAVATEESRA